MAGNKADIASLIKQLQLNFAATTIEKDKIRPENQKTFEKKLKEWNKRLKETIQEMGQLSSELNDKKDKKQVVNYANRHAVPDLTGGSGDATENLNAWKSLLEMINKLIETAIADQSKKSSGSSSG
ncbi:uncharacterized protein LOC133867663 [Alnus glutinosa]|uniref:uncharacterized protein LOC133867663 n=1 Tax=Alnus glutinosa TaxID=3517 RepID=UPI002D76F918|nr:uncharacterized protein LOC133867663 [Alnus glutinosa]